MHKSQGNAIWFDDAAEEMGVDVMRWVFCGHNPTVNLNFGYGVVDQVRRGLINTLWNVYSFLCNYGRLDDFDPESARVPVDERPDIDLLAETAAGAPGAPAVRAREEEAP